jgi:hypothetical protein
MRSTLLLSLILCLTACHRTQNNEAVRQGVIDYLSKAGMNVAVMDVALTSVQINGNAADVNVNVTLKGKTDSPPMAFGYHMEQKNDKWVVTGHNSATPHGKEAMPGAPGAPGANPHGGAMPPSPGATGAPTGGSRMPSPGDLPPVTKKK